VSVGPPCHALIGVSAAPQADGVSGHAATPGGFGVGVAAGGVQHDPYTDDLLVTGGMGVGELLEPVAFGGGQDDLACAGGGHRRAFRQSNLDGLTEPARKPAGRRRPTRPPGHVRTGNM
jgi:hypothetical protein